MTGDSVRETLDEIVAVRHGSALDPRRNRLSVPISPLESLYGRVNAPRYVVRRGAASDRVLRFRCARAAGATWL